MNVYQFHLPPMKKEALLCSACLELFLACSSLFQLFTACPGSFHVITSDDLPECPDFQIYDKSISYKNLLPNITYIITKLNSFYVLKSTTSVIKMYDRFFVLQSGESGIPDQDRCQKVDNFCHKVRKVLQSGANFITKWDRHYKVEQLLRTKRAMERNGREQQVSLTDSLISL